MKNFFLFPILAIAATVVMLSSCNSDKEHQTPFQGTYSGVFTVTYKSADKPMVRSGHTTITVSGNNYRCAGNPDRVPAGGSGSCFRKNGKIIFSDENIWTADFDGSLILHGEYNFILLGGKLKLSMEHEYARYEYDLEKINK